MILTIIPSFMQNFEMVYMCLFCLFMIELTEWIDDKWKK